MTILVFTLILLLAAYCAGLLGSLTGLGGGVVIIPVLTLGFGVDFHYAIGAALVSSIATSSGSGSAYVKEGMTNVRLGMFLEIATSIGAVCGAAVAIYLNNNIIAVIQYAFTLLVIHGYVHGTKILEMIRNRFENTRTVSIKRYQVNNGETEIVIAA